MNIKQAVAELKSGRIIIYPTETSYAIGADATDRKAVDKIFHIKQRDRGKPLSIIVDSLEMIENYAVINKQAKKLIHEFMPGPLALIVPVKHRALPDNLCQKTVAFRISSNTIAHSLCHALGRPITATSANLSGNEPIYNISKIKKQFPKLFVLDAGNLHKNPVSTVYDVENKTVLRKGIISEKQINCVL